MTLILNCLTNDYVIQVSDRRLTFLHSGQVKDDDTNKAVLWNGLVAFAYTGIAAVDDESTDIWLTRTLIEAAEARLPPQLPPLLTYLTGAATEAFARLTRLHRRIFHHAFVGVGWVRIRQLEHQRVVPFTCSVSNALDENGNWLPSAQSEFTWRARTLDVSEPLYLSSAGQQLDEAHTHQIQRELRRVIKGGAGPQSATRFLVDAVRAVAAGNKTVGSNMMVACIPRKPAERLLAGDFSSMLKHSAPNLNTNSFQYVSAKTTVGYGPHTIFGSQYSQMTKLDAPKGINPTTGTVDFTDGCVEWCIKLPDPPKHHRPYQHTQKAATSNITPNPSQRMPSLTEVNPQPVGNRHERRKQKSLARKSR